MGAPAWSPRSSPRWLQVSVHDVAPRWGDAVRRLLDALVPRLGASLSLAVVPAWDGVRIDPHRDRSLLDAIASSGAEVLQHGFTHRAPRTTGAVGLLTGGANELAGLDRDHVRERLGRGRDWLGELLGRRPVGLVPPAWAPGPVDDALLRELGFAFMVTLGQVRSVDGRSRRLATRSWDTGRFAWLDPLGEGLGQVAARMLPDAVDHVVLHPRDLERGWLPRALARIDALRSAGRTPARWETLLAAVLGGT